MISDSRKIQKFGFTSENKEYKKILYLGTHITKKSLDVGFYYFNVTNWFWDLIESVYNSEELTNAINNYKHCLKQNSEIESNRNALILCLQKHGIVINDLIGLCEYSGSKDEQIIYAVPNNGKDGFHDVPSLMKEADLIVVNGLGLYKNRVKEKSARYYMNEFGFDTLVDESKIVYVYGSTPGKPGLEAKKENWSNTIKEAIGDIKV